MLVGNLRHIWLVKKSSYPIISHHSLFSHGSCRCFGRRSDLKIKKLLKLTVIILYTVFSHNYLGHLLQSWSCAIKKAQLLVFAITCQRIIVSTESTVTDTRQSFSFAKVSVPLETIIPCVYYLRRWRLWGRRVMKKRWLSKRRFIDIGKKWYKGTRTDGKRCMESDELKRDNPLQPHRKKTRRKTIYYLNITTVYSEIQVLSLLSIADLNWKTWATAH